LQLDINDSIEELQSLHKERRQVVNHPSVNEEGTSSPTISKGTSSRKAVISNTKEKKSIPNAKKQQPKPTLRSIVQMPVGKLTATNLNSLCNSIRHHRKGSSFNNLKVLERILLELDHPHQTLIDNKVYLKKIHVFSLLTALSKDVKLLKQKESRGKKYNNRDRPSKIGQSDVQRLINVVSLLSKLRHHDSIDHQCYSKDVPSFATMIASELSRVESSAVNAALLFLNMVEKEEGETEYWDPRLIGAVLDTLARVGRAEEAQKLLEKATGVCISSFNSKANSTEVADITSTKRLDIAYASPCYDALLRAYSKKAEYQNAKTKSQSSYRNIPMSALSSLSQARHILLNHIPTQPELSITNKTCTAVLQGYATLGLGSEANQLLNEIEALHLSPLYTKQSLGSLSSKSVTPSSSLDVIAYNTVLHAYSQSKQSFQDVNSAEKLFLAMKEQTPLEIFVGVSSVAILPPQADFISYSSMLNCYCKHGRVNKAETLLNEMSLQKMQPNAACYLPIITSLEKSNDILDVPERLMKLMESSDKSLPRPSRAIYSAALRCLRRHGKGALAEIILDRYQHTLPNSGPDIHSYLVVLMAWERTISKEDRLEAAERAEIFFDGMQKKAKQDVDAYNILLNCYARVGLHEKIEKQITVMEESFNVQPNNKSYSMLIKALSNSDSKYTVTFAWEVLYRLGFPRTVKEGKPFQKIPEFNVSVDNLNSMLKLFAKRGMAADAEALLKDMDDMKMDDILTESPNIRSYEAVLEALGRCEDIDAPTRAEALITRLEVKAELGGDLKPSLLAYNSLLNIYGNAGSVGKAERLLERLDGADTYSVASTIKAITNSGKNQLGSISLAKSLSDKMGSANNDIIYAHRLKLLAKFGLGSEAEELLEQMKDHKLSPSIIHYTAALNAYAKSKEDGSLVRAEELFKTMESKFDLDLTAYHGLLLNYSTRGKAKKARRLLQQILNSSFEPNRSSFTMAIDSYARSKAPNAGQKAEELLNQMIELHAAGNRDVEPDNVTYASVIRSMKGKKKIKDLESFDKISLMQSLQLESWPFEEALI